MRNISVLFIVSTQHKYRLLLLLMSKVDFVFIKKIFFEVKVYKYRKRMYKFTQKQGGE